MARTSPHGVAKRELERLVRELGARGERRLPAEDQLSIDLDCSRPTVRSALLSLQKEGLIQRRHGRGTFINLHALDVRANLATAAPFLDLIEAEGFAAGMDVGVVEDREADESLAGRLGIPVGTPVRAIERVFTADGEPAVTSVDQVPTVALRDDAPRDAVERSTFAFVERWTARQVSYSVADVVAVVATDELATVLDVAPGTPLLQLEHLHVDDDDVPVALTRAHIRQAFLRFTVIRDRLEA